MSNSYFNFKQFTVHQERCAMKVTTDGCLFGAWAAREIQKRGHETRNLLDIGTGTGLLSLMVMQKNPELIVDAVELDQDAVGQAKENIRAAPFKNKSYLFHTDIRHYAADRKYDAIISNPPFYEREIPSTNAQKNIAHHHTGLLLEELLPLIKGRLTGSSRFYLLMPYKRINELEQAFRKTDLNILQKMLVRQTPKHDYFRLMIEGALYADWPAKESEMAIRDEKDNYTAAFTSLLKDYYLHL